MYPGQQSPSSIPHLRIYAAIAPCVRMTESRHRRMYQMHQELLPKSKESSEKECEDQKTKKACSMLDSCNWLLTNSTCASAVIPTTMQSKAAPPYYKLRTTRFLEYDKDRDSTGAYGIAPDKGGVMRFSEPDDPRVPSSPQVGLDLFVQHNINSLNPKRRVFPIHWPWDLTNKDGQYDIGPTAIVKGCSLYFPEN
jgi:hypothetical protein